MVKSNSFLFFSNKDVNWQLDREKERKKSTHNVAPRSCRGFVAQWFESPTSNRKTQVRFPGGAALCCFFFRLIQPSVHIFVGNEKERVWFDGSRQERNFDSNKLWSFLQGKYIERTQVKNWNTITIYREIIMEPAHALFWPRQCQCTHWIRYMGSKLE